MTPALAEPVNRTILLLDIESFSKRDNVEQPFLRRGLHDVVEDTLAGAGVERTQQYREDRGDGLIILVSGDIPKAALLRALLTTTPDALRGYNRFAARSTQMRLRMVLASGEVAHDPRRGTVGGLVGHDLNQACRLLDAPVLREALRQRPDADCVLCVSAPVYVGVVRHGYRGLRPEEFHRVAVAVKEDRLDAWLHGPVPQGASVLASGSASDASGGPGTDAGTPAGAPAAPGVPAADCGLSITVNGGSMSFGGGLVRGHQTGVSGGQVTGDVVMGSVHHESRGDRA